MDKKRRECPDCSGEGFDRRQFLRTAGARAAAAAGGLPLFARAEGPGRPDAQQPRRNGRQGTLRHAHRRTEKDRLLRLGLPGQGTTACSAPTSPTTGRSPSRTSSATSTPRSSRTSSTTSGRASSTPSGTTSSSSSSRTTPAGRNGASSRASPSSASRAASKFEFVITGRHMTLRADGHSQDHVAFGGPIFYGHAASGFNEKVHHPGNVFWHQAVEANKLYGMLDPKQQAEALVEKRPKEAAVGFQGDKGRSPASRSRNWPTSRKRSCKRCCRC